VTRKKTHRRNFRTNVIKIHFNGLLGNRRTLSLPQLADIHESHRQGQWGTQELPYAAWPSRRSWWDAGGRWCIADWRLEKSQWKLRCTQTLSLWASLWCPSCQQRLCRSQTVWRLSSISQQPFGWRVSCPTFRYICDPLTSFSSAGFLVCLFHKSWWTVSGEPSRSHWPRLKSNFMSGTSWLCSTAISVPYMQFNCSGRGRNSKSYPLK